MLEKPQPLAKEPGAARDCIESYTLKPLNDDESNFCFELAEDLGSGRVVCFERCCRFSKVCPILSKTNQRTKDFLSSRRATADLGALTEREEREFMRSEGRR